MNYPHEARAAWQNWFVTGKFTPRNRCSVIDGVFIYTFKDGQSIRLDINNGSVLKD